MKIGINFHTSDRYISGVEYYSLGLINGLLRIDGKNEYVVFTNQPELIKSHIIQSENLAVRRSDYLKTRLQRILWEHFRLPQIAKKEGLDVLHCPHYICPFFSTTVPYVATVHDTIAIDHPGWCKPSNAMYYNIFIKQTVRKASRLITVSSSTAENLRRNFSVNGSKIRIIHPGIDAIFNDEKNYSRQNEVKARYGLPEKYILFVGNIEPKKNVLRLVQAYKMLQDRGLGHKLVLAGKRTWGCRDVWNHIHREFSAEDIILTGYVERDDLPFVYQMADVFVFVSRCEGFGFPPLEAMACGTPVVASATGVFEETDSKACCLVDPNNSREIAEAIYLLITNEKLRQKYTELGVKEKCRFGWDNAAKQTLSIYKEALESQ